MAPLGSHDHPWPHPCRGRSGLLSPFLQLWVGWGLAPAKAGQSRCPSKPEWEVEAGQAHALATPTHPPARAALELRGHLLRPWSHPPAGHLFWQPSVQLASLLGPFPTFLPMPTVLPGACSRAGMEPPAPQACFRSVGRSVGRLGALQTRERQGENKSGGTAPKSPALAVTLLITQAGHRGHCRFP